MLFVATTLKLLGRLVVGVDAEIASGRQVRDTELQSRGNCGWSNVAIFFFVLILRRRKLSSN